MQVGVDLGSRTIKVCVLEGGDIVHQQVVESGFAPHRQAREMVERFRPCRVVATGYGRHLAHEHFADGVLTEIRAHALGIHHLVPGCTTVIDIGGQDSKVISLDANGRVRNFQMNDKCAAGTGRFLEIMAASLAFPLDEFGQGALEAEEEVQINSMCTVFAESEVISMKNRGVDRRKIARAVHGTVADRIVAMLNRVGCGTDIAFSGGVAHNPCIVAMISARLPEARIHVPQYPDVVGALGAALQAGAAD
ncbi:MAG: 3-hydroxyacyl-ACP dehydratase [Desulfobulbaceae bacterium A2]|nr:MAG: 3-hydroxyacyl-ACP dehydratase [Desulfobulbaceae bacterium A2]